MNTTAQAHAATDAVHQAAPHRHVMAPQQMSAADDGSTMPWRMARVPRSRRSWLRPQPNRLFMNTLTISATVPKAISNPPSIRLPWLRLLSDIILGLIGLLFLMSSSLRRSTAHAIH